jgi:outer membrane protein TolC
LTAAREDLIDEQVGVRTDVVRLARELESARRETTAYRNDVLPLAEQTFKAAEIAWVSGRGMLTDLMESRRAYIQTEILMAKAEAMEWDRLNDIAFTCGLTIEELLQGKLPTAGSADGPTQAQHR